MLLHIINFHRTLAALLAVSERAQPRKCQYGPKSRRCIAIPDFLYDDITAYITSLYDMHPDDRIFYFTKSFLEKEIKRVAALADLKPIRVHNLRHSHASLLIDMGFDILERSERLGHESVKITWDTYSHLYPDKDKKLASALNDSRR